VTRVLIADDHAAVRRGVRSIIESRPKTEVCGEAEDGQEAINSAASLRPDLIILDVTMPVLGGFGAAKVLREMLPNIPILFYSMHEGEYIISEAKRLGASGFVCKSDLAATLLDAVEALVVHKSTYFPGSKDEPKPLPVS
jgi:DNA-binding NarL/FixJ family response regulator